MRSWWSSAAVGLLAVGGCLLAVGGCLFAPAAPGDLGDGGPGDGGTLNGPCGGPTSMTGDQLPFALAFSAAASSGAATLVRAGVCSGQLALTIAGPRPGFDPLTPDRVVSLPEIPAERDPVVVALAPGPDDTVLVLAAAGGEAWLVGVTVTGAAPHRLLAHTTMDFALGEAAYVAYHPVAARIGFGSGVAQWTLVPGGTSVEFAGASLFTTDQLVGLMPRQSVGALPGWTGVGQFSELGYPLDFSGTPGVDAYPAPCTAMVCARVVHPVRAGGALASTVGVSMTDGGQLMVFPDEGLAQRATVELPTDVNAGDAALAAGAETPVSLIVVEPTGEVVHHATVTLASPLIVSSLSAAPLGTDAIRGPRSLVAGDFGDGVRAYVLGHAPGSAGWERACVDLSSGGTCL